MALARPRKLLKPFRPIHSRSYFREKEKPPTTSSSVTNDYAERDTVISMGGMAQSCEDFVKDVDRVLREREAFVKKHNRRESNRYKRQ